MQVEFNRRALWGVAAFLALACVAADHPIARVGVVGGAAVIA